ncbi:hypothetical protein GGX14DRAFT_692325, partial [Mycena pura]
MVPIEHVVGNVRKMPSSSSWLHAAESRAIGRYIALKYRDQDAFPKGNLKKIGHFERALSIEMAQFMSARLQAVYKPVERRNLEEVARLATELRVAQKLDAYDQIFSKSKAMHVHILLYGVMSMQTFSYFQKFVKDSNWLKGLVTGVWLLETLQLVLIGHVLYYWLIANYTNPAVLANSTWSFNLGILVTNLIVLIVELFLTYRVFILSN